MYSSFCFIEVQKYQALAWMLDVLLNLPVSLSLRLGSVLVQVRAACCVM
jgi:hypothetical protein